MLKSPVKMNNFATKMSNRKQDVDIGKYSRIILLGKRTKLVSLKAQVVKVSNVKQVPIKNQGTLKKQEVIFRDTTSSIKLILWKDNIES